MNSNRPEEVAGLRKQAEVIAGERAAQSAENLETLSPGETRQMLHDLRVHQIELEMQNEDLRRVQVELDVQRAHYFDFYNSVPVGYLTSSEKGLILEANLTAGTFLGVAMDALLQQPVSSFILPDDQDIFYLQRKQLFESGVAQACDLRMVRKGGAAFWVNLALTTVQNANGVCCIVISDITERKCAEQNYRTLFHEMLDGFAFHDIICDEKGNPIDYRFIAVNPAFERMTGLKMKDIAGKTVLEIMPNTERHWIEIYGKVAITGEPAVFENTPSSSTNILR